MAEFVMKHLVKQSSLEGSFLIDSKATSTEEIGNTMHQGTIKKLREQKGGGKKGGGGGAGKGGGVPGGGGGQGGGGGGALPQEVTSD